MTLRNDAEKVLASNHTSYDISKRTGVSQATIHRLRRNKQKIGETRLRTVEKLADYYKNV